MSKNKNHPLSGWFFPLYKGKLPVCVSRRFKLFAGRISFIIFLQCANFHYHLLCYFPKCITHLFLLLISLASLIVSYEFPIVKLLWYQQFWHIWDKFHRVCI